MLIIAVHAAMLLLATGAEDGRTWIFDQDRDVPAAHLMYATPESDDVAIALSCRVGSGEILVNAPVSDDLGRRLSGDRWVDKAGRPAPWPLSASFASGALTLPIRALAQADEMNGGVMVEAKLPAASAVAKAFAASGDLRLVALGETVQAPPAPVATARAFVRVCAPQP